MVSSVLGKEFKREGQASNILKSREASLRTLVILALNHHPN